MLFRDLGRFMIEVDELEVPLRGGRPASVLALLVAQAGNSVTADALIEATWGQRPPARAPQALETVVWRLRAVLEPGRAAGSEANLLRRDAVGYRLHVPVESIDSQRFTEASRVAKAALADGDASGALARSGRALALWRGEPYQSVADAEWMSAVREGLTARRIELAECHVQALLDTGQPELAIQELTPLLVEHPFRERLWAQRMVGLYRTGRQADALAAYAQARRVLDEELGIEPGPELRALHEQVLAQSPLLDWVPASQAFELTATPAGLPRVPMGQDQDDAPLRDLPAGRRLSSGRATGEPDLSRGSERPGPSSAEPTRGQRTVGRGNELAVVDALLDQVNEGGQRWLLFTGPAGIGKTRLAREMVAGARERGMLTAWTSCPDDDGIPAWWPLRPWVADLGGDPDAVFLPPRDVDADTMRFGVYERLATHLSTIGSGRPLVVVVDDAQWLDAASLRCLTVLTRSLRAEGLGIVITVRDGEERPELSQLISALGQAAAASHVAVPPLDTTDAAELLSQVATENVTSAEAAALARRTGGNPLLLSEYARLPRDQWQGERLPLAARGVVQRRLNRLAEPVLIVLRAAAVIGEVFELDLLADVVDLGMAEVIDRLDPAAAEAIIGPAQSGAGYRFLHALVRDEMISQLSVMRRQALHVRVADKLISRGNDPRTLIRRARHLSAGLAVADPDLVEQACTIAARDAEARWDWDAAAAQWEAALVAQQAQGYSDPTRRNGLMVARLIALARAGRYQTVLDDTTAALDDAAGQTAIIGRLAATLLRTSGAWPWAAFGADPTVLLTRLEDLAPTLISDPAAHAQVLAALAVGNCYAPDRTRPDRQSRQALQIAEELNDPDVLADALVGRVLAYAGDATHAEEASELLGRLDALPHAHAPADEVLRHDALTMAMFSQGEMDGVQRHLREGVVGSDRLRLPVTRVQFRWVEATLAQWHGNFDQAESLVEKAFQLHQQTELYSAENAHSSAYLAILWEKGAVSSEPELIRRTGEPLIWGALAAAETGDIVAGRELLARRLADPRPDYWYWLWSATVLAHAAADLNCVEFVPVLLNKLKPNRNYITALGQTASAGPVALATGRLHAMAGDHDEARADLAIAERLARSGYGRPALLRTRLAQLLLDPPHDDRAGALRQLADEATRIGMKGVAAAAVRACSDTSVPDGGANGT